MAPGPIAASIRSLTEFVNGIRFLSTSLDMERGCVQASCAPAKSYSGVGARAELTEHRRKSPLVRIMYIMLNWIWHRNHAYQPWLSDSLLPALHISTGITPNLRLAPGALREIRWPEPHNFFQISRSAPFLHCLSQVRSAYPRYGVISKLFRLRVKPRGFVHQRRMS